MPAVSGYDREAVNTALGSWIVDDVVESSALRKRASAMDWKAVMNLVGSSAGAGVAAGVAAWQAAPAAGWPTWVGAGVTGALLYGVGHLRQSPLNPK